MGADRVEDLGEREVVLAERGEEVRAAVSGGVRDEVGVDSAEERVPLAYRDVWIRGLQPNVRFQSLGWGTHRSVPSIGPG